jgi:glucose-6-phosphate 1-dehydrogenase
MSARRGKGAPMADRQTLILFGATGDLARHKLWPALHDLAATGRLPDRLDVLGISRSASTEDIRELAGENGSEHGRLDDSDRWRAIVESIEAVNGAADDPGLYERLAQALDGREGGRLAYLSVAPSLFGEIAGHLAGIGLGRGSGSRIVIEKPFGEDLASARELRAQLHEHFEEDQLFRIDHYLGKETAQNLMVLRFANGIFEPLWDRRSISSVQITVAEDGGVDGRGEFYDATGALRDVGQNHLLQLLALTLMDAPGRLEGDELRAERLKVLRAIVPVEPGDAVLGQYEGYEGEDGIAGGSTMDTYAAMRVQVDSWRWAGVPCYLRTGKKLRCKAAEIAIEFRGSPHLPFESGNGGPGPNRLVVGIQPGERVQLHVSGKRPGEGLDIADLALDFDSGDDVERDAPEAYERLLGDALAGDQTLFTSSAEVEAQWTAVAPLLDARPDPERYAAGAEGPAAADALPERDGRTWRTLEELAG